LLYLQCRRFTSADDLFQPVIEHLVHFFSIPIATTFNQQNLSVLIDDHVQWNGVNIKNLG